MKITLRTISNQESIFEVEPVYTIAKIKQILQNQQNFGKFSIQFIFNGQILDENSTLKEINYTEKDYIIIHKVLSAKISLNTSANISPSKKPTTPVVKRYK